MIQQKWSSTSEEWDENGERKGKGKENMIQQQQIYPEIGDSCTIHIGNRILRAISNHTAGVYLCMNQRLTLIFLEVILN